MTSKMEKKAMSLNALTLSLVILLVLSASTVHAITCNEELNKLMPCLPFLTGVEPKPPVTCCSGVEAVNSEARTKEDRKALCKCFKETGPALGVKAEKAKQLPGMCSVKVSVPIDPNVDCSSIHF